jgi:hypothetical protein
MMACFRPQCRCAATLVLGIIRMSPKTNDPQLRVVPTLRHRDRGKQKDEVEDENSHSRILHDRASISFSSRL